MPTGPFSINSGGFFCTIRRIMDFSLSDVSFAIADSPLAIVPRIDGKET